MKAELVSGLLQVILFLLYSKLIYNKISFQMLLIYQYTIDLPNPAYQIFRANENI